jgi:hypothetical protein
MRRIKRLRKSSRSMSMKITNTMASPALASRSTSGPAIIGTGQKVDDCSDVQRLHEGALEPCGLLNFLHLALDLTDSFLHLLDGSPLSHLTQINNLFFDVSLVLG